MRVRDVNDFSDPIFDEDDQEEHERPSCKANSVFAEDGGYGNDLTVLLQQ